MTISVTDVSEAMDRIIKERDELREAFRKITVDSMVLEAELEVLRAEAAKMRPVYELARRWCNRPESVLRAGGEVFANDAELWRELRVRVAAAEAKERADG